MIKKISFCFCVLFLSIALFANGKKEPTEDAQCSSSKKEHMHKAVNNSSTEYEFPSKTPQRTVAGTIAILDMLDYLGVDIVAIPNTNKNLNSKYMETPRIGMPMTPDMERIKLAKPDFFITTLSLKNNLEPQLKTIGVESAFLNLSTYEEYLKAMQYLGKVYKKEKKAKEYISRIEEKNSTFKHNEKDSPNVLIVFGSPSSMSITTNKAFSASLVKLIGGKNIWQDTSSASSYVPMNLEFVKAANPDIILCLSHVKPSETHKMFEQEFKNEFWSKLSAVKNKKVFYLDNDYFGVSGNIHIPEALDMLEKMLYSK